MHDHLRPTSDPLENLDGFSPPLFRHFLLAGEDEVATADAAALTARLAPQGEPVWRRDRAELIALGSGPDGSPDRVHLGAGREFAEGAHCAVAVSPRGFAARERHRFERVDVGLDGSREAAAALAVAVHIARLADARLRLIAVAELSFELGGAPRPVPSHERERLERHLRAAAADATGVRVERELREGLPDQLLLGFAREADLLVLGSRASYGGSGRLTLGAVAQRLLDGAACPLLLVPAP